MQKNSTSIIVRRSLLALAFIALTHLIARLMWQLKAFGLNSPDDNCHYGEATEQELSNGWIVSGPVVVCEPITGTSFFEYTGETWPIIGTHLIGIVATILIFVLISWIVVDKSTKVNPDCTDARCPCVTHTAEVFVDGAWDIRECTNPDCKCKAYH